MESLGLLVKKFVEIVDTDEEFSFDKKINAQISELKVGKEKVKLVAPDTFMNNSGKSVKPLITSVKGAEKLMVIYDDLDLPFGSSKISFNKSSVVYVPIGKP